VDFLWHELQLLLAIWVMPGGKQVGTMEKRTQQHIWAGEHLLLNPRRGLRYA